MGDTRPPVLTKIGQGLIYERREVCAMGDATGLVAHERMRLRKQFAVLLRLRPMRVQRCGEHAGKKSCETALVCLNLIGELSGGNDVFPSRPSQYSVRRLRRSLRRRASSHRAG